MINVLSDDRLNFFACDGGGLLEISIFVRASVVHPQVCVRECVYDMLDTGMHLQVPVEQTRGFLKRGLLQREDLSTIWYVGALVLWNVDHSLLLMSMALVFIHTAGQKVPWDEGAVALGVDVPCDWGTRLNDPGFLQVPQHFQDPREALPKDALRELLRARCEMDYHV